MHRPLAGEDALLKDDSWLKDLIRDYLQEHISLFSQDKTWHLPQLEAVLDCHCLWREIFGFPDLSSPRCERKIQRNILSLYSVWHHFPQKVVNLSMNWENKSFDEKLSHLTKNSSKTREQNELKSFLKVTFYYKWVCSKTKFHLSLPLFKNCQTEKN